MRIFGDLVKKIIGSSFNKISNPINTQWIFCLYISCGYHRLSDFCSLYSNNLSYFSCAKKSWENSHIVYLESHVASSGQRKSWFWRALVLQLLRIRPTMQRLKVILAGVVMILFSSPFFTLRSSNTYEASMMLHVYFHAFHDTKCWENCDSDVPSN